MKYANQLTEDELKELFLKFVQSCYGLVVKATFPSKTTKQFVRIKGLCNSCDKTVLEYSVDIEWYLNDYDVYVYNSQDDSYEIVYSFESEYRKYMRSKFEEQYACDCFWHEFDGDQL